MVEVGFLLEGMAGPGSGAWSRFENLATALLSVGVAVHVSGVEGHHDRALALGVESVELSPRPSRLSRLIGRPRKILDFARRTGSQVVHLEAPPFIGSSEVTTVAAVHDLRYLTDASLTNANTEALYQKYALKRLSRDIQAWLTLTDWGSVEVIELLNVDASRVATIPPIVEVPSELRVDLPQTPYVLALGHLEPRKNIEVLVRAAGLKAWPPGVELWLAGEDHGSLEELKQLAGSSVGKIKFLGSVSDSDKWDLLAGAALVAVPSRIEGFGIVSVEAPLAGSVALVSDQSGLVELAAHPLARVTWNSPSAWAHTVSAVLEDNALLGEILEAQKAAAEAFSAPKVVPKLLEMYAHLGFDHSIERAQ